MGRSWIDFVSDCAFGFTLYVWIFVGFGFSGIGNLKEDLRLSFVSLGLLHLESLAPKGEC
jgi:hypothetical protein